MTVMIVIALSNAVSTRVNAHGDKKHETSAKQDRADAKSAKTYPLDTCVVSGDKLDHDGKPYVFKHKGQEVQLCCKDCVKDFKKDPHKYVQKINEARQKADK